LWFYQDQEVRYVALRIRPADASSKGHRTFAKAEQDPRADWLDEYSIRQFETKETTLEQRKQANEEAAAAKVINIKDSPVTKKTAAG